MKADAQNGVSRITLEVPAEHEETLIAELWALGTLGVETLEDGAGVRLEAYFENPPGTDVLERAADRCDAKLGGTTTIEDRDWLAEYRAACEPVSIGRLVIDPREPDPGEARPSDEVLRIPARNAFGTGSHESTRLMLEALVGTDLVGRSVLDVGTGSAILALAALWHGAGTVVGCDIDVASVVTARDNCKLNGSWPLLLAGGAETLKGSFDVILVNILPHRWLATADSVAARLKPGGEMLVSGILTPELEGVASRLEGLGLTVGGMLQTGDWSALRMRGAPGGAT